MKGKVHFAIALFLSILLYIPLSQYSLYFNLSYWIIWISLFLFVLGSILPDSDSKDKGSFVFTSTKTFWSSLNNNMKKTNNQKNHEEYETLVLIAHAPFIIFGIISIPFAWITNKMEGFVSLYTKRQKGHKESLHTLYGVLVISLFWTFILTIAALFCGYGFNIFVLIIVFTSLLFGQIIHLVEDLMKDWKNGWAIHWK